MVMDLGKRDSNRDMWDILPNRCYLEFITKGLGLRCEQGQDPFDLGFFNDLDRGTYVDRPQMQEICRPGNRIILRRQAEDVQSVASATAALLGRSSETLAVELNLTSVEPDSRRGILDGKSSLLSLEPLLRKIFDVYWEHLISLHSDILRVFCNDDQWRRMLRWFYKRCPLSTPNVDIPVLKECVTGLQNGADPSRTSLRDTFDRLIKLVTYSASYSDFTGEKRKYQLYEWITVVLDDRQLSSAAMNPLLTDFETMVSLSIEQLDFKLFIDQNCEPQVRRRNWAQSRPTIIVLRWEDDELRQLIRRRIFSRMPGASTTDDNLLPDYSLGERLAGFLQPQATRHVEDAIVRGAQGSPLHALRLVQGLVAACGGCWSERYSPPLSIHDIEKLIESYHSYAGTSP